MAGLSDLRARAVRGAFSAMQSTRFVRFLQRRRVMALLVEGMSVRANSARLLDRLGRSAARALGLATLADLRAVEQELRDRLDGPGAPGPGPASPDPGSSRGRSR